MDNVHAPNLSTQWLTIERSSKSIISYPPCHWSKRFTFHLWQSVLTLCQRFTDVLYSLTCATSAYETPHSTNAGNIRDYSFRVSELPLNPFCLPHEYVFFAYYRCTIALIVSLIPLRRIATNTRCELHSDLSFCDGNKYSMFSSRSGEIHYKTSCDGQVIINSRVLKK